MKNVSESSSSISSDNSIQNKGNESTLFLVKHPFFIQNKEDALLFKTKNTLEYHFDETVFSKKITAEVSENNYGFVECEYDDDGNVVVLNEFQSVYEFKELADFVIKEPEASKTFYKDMHEILLETDLDRFIGNAEKLNEYLKTKNFPIYYPHKFIKAKHWDMDLQIKQIGDVNRVKAYTIKIEDEIPLKHPENVKDNFIKNNSAELYEKTSAFIREHFKENILSTKDIENKFEMHKTGEFTQYALRYTLVEHYYILNEGPWRRCWIKFGYDPKADQENYIYQKIDVNNKNLHFQIKNNSELVQEIEKKRDWYIKKKFDAKNGFLHEACLKLINYIHDKKNIKITDECDKNEEYELFD